MSVTAATTPQVTLPPAPNPGVAYPAAAPNFEETPWLDPAVITKRTHDGRIAEQTAGELPNNDIIKRGPPAYFRTYEQMKTAIYDLQSKYPDLVKVSVLGPTSEKAAGKADRDILALTITNQKATGPKTVVEEIGGMHAREIANPELLMTWANQLLSGFGRDPEATNLLNTREIDLVPMMNPDGHAMIEKAYAGVKGGSLMQRKNTSPPAGTDLNRNFEFHWGGAGASSNPNSETYRGASAASEVEVKALQKFTAERKPNTFTDWHSYSQLNLYPWGDTKTKAPDHEGLKAVAEKFSTFNHYSPIQSIDLYPTTGTSDDWVYGAVGKPAWAVETGRSFHQDDNDFAQTLKENIPVLWYSTKIADDPYNKVKGPDATDIVVDPSSHHVQATVSDLTSGKNKIKSAEVVLDPYAPTGSGIPLLPVTGAFDAPSETVSGQLPAELAKIKSSTGQLLYVRAQDDQGNWGPVTAQWLKTPGSGARLSPVPAKIQR